MARVVSASFCTWGPMSKILVVDDESHVRDILQRILTGAGHDVTTAPDGNVALEMVHQSSFDVVITDLIMPEKEGIETIQELLTLEDRPKIIAMSGGGRVGPVDYLKAAESLGADASLAKPFDPERVLGIVDELLGNPSGDEQTST